MKMVGGLLISTLALATNGLQAQDLPSFDGTWRMTMQHPDASRPRDGEIVLKGTSGTWKIYARKNLETINNPCVGTAFPLTILPSTPDVALTFRVIESEIVMGCPDFEPTMHWVTAHKLEGKTHGGTVITMERD